MSCDEGIESSLDQVTSRLEVLQQRGTPFLFRGQCASQGYRCTMAFMPYFYITSFLTSFYCRCMQTHTSQQQMGWPRGPRLPLYTLWPC